MGGVVKGVTDTVFGNKDGTAASTTDMNSAKGNEIQGQLLGQYQGMANQDYGAMAQNQSDQQELQARQNVQDQEMKAQQIVTQRGLGNTSLGMNAIIGQGQELGNQIGAIRAARPGLANQMRQQGLGAATQGINSILGQQSSAKIHQPAKASNDTGLLGAAMPVLGIMAGGYVAGGGLAAKAVMDR